MRVLYLGTYERDYPRNALVISCLRGAGVDVVESHVPLWEGQEHKLELGLGPLGRALRAELRLVRRSAESADVLLVGYPGQLDMLVARRVARGRPVVFNPLVSLWDTIVGDRGLVRSRSPKAGAVRRLDALAFRRADLVVADTEAHARFFAAQFGIPAERLAVCFVGADDRLFTPGWAPADPFRALFVGKLIPLHGLEVILEAARRTPGIEFVVVGSGQLEDTLRSHPPNVRWEPWLDYELLPGAYRTAGCALGIFGSGTKASRVIPNKAFQALATGTPLITADTPAARELLEDGRDALLVPPGDPEALASAVERLAVDRQLAESIGRNGRETYEEHASEDVLGRQWLSVLESLLVHAGAGARARAR